MNDHVDRDPANTVSKIRNGPSGASVQHFGTPVKGISLWGSSPLCEIGISRRSVYQMKTSREQARGEGYCAISLLKVLVTERGEEACECMGRVAGLLGVESVDCHQCVIPYSNAFSPNLPFVTYRNIL